MAKNCVCGHHFEEHGDDPNYPGSTACNVQDCDCICFEEDDGSDIE